MGQTDLSRAQADFILARIDSILKQLPEAKRQAHERIIGERPVFFLTKKSSAFMNPIST